MHQIQEQLLNLLEIENLSGMSLREIGAHIGENSAQKIKHHLTQLSKRGFITYAPKQKIIRKNPKVSKDGFISIPIVGGANCGPATIFAEENIQGHLKISKGLLPTGNKLFILRAGGDSLNRAQINGKNIEDGDFVVVDSAQRTPQFGTYIVAIIDDLANIKRFISDPPNKRIILKSESTSEYLPIYIHENDECEISGTVVDVIKK